MNNLSQAIKIAVSVRTYLRENAGGSRPCSKEVMENHERITNQLKNISKLG